MAGVPDLMYQARVRYAPALVTSPFVEASVHGLGSYKSDDANLFGVPAYTVVDLSAGVRNVPLASERLSLHAWVTLANAFDKTYVSSAFVNPDLNGAKEPIYLEPGLPRNVMGSLGLEWLF
jgi:outer membrane receptor protein involved in Fe transport